jgi:hypothetical protein
MSSAEAMKRVDEIYPLMVERRPVVGGETGSLPGRDEPVARVSGFRLQIELVPSPLWYRSLRSVVSPKVWDDIRHSEYRKAGFKCAVCGYQALPGRGKLFCHERWLYDDERHIQKLVGFEVVCQWCNGIKHIGIAGITGDVDYNTLIRHFRRVNECNYEDFVLARALAFQVWEERSEFEWSQDFGEWSGLVHPSEEREVVDGS